MAIDGADGRPWILLPGTLCTASVFDGVLDALGVPIASRHPVVLSHPGVEDYAGPLEALCTPGAIVCGFSLGAIVAAHLADRVEAAGLLLFGLNPHADDPGKRDGRLALERDVRAMGGRAALASRLGPLAGPDPAAARALVLEMADRSAADMGAQTALALGRPGAVPALSRAAMPVACLTGTEDQQAPPAVALDAVRAAPQGRFEALEGLGHYALIEDAALCARAAENALLAM
jgi:pimeloyl-ACP methyl ester carboxylesterase